MNTRWACASAVALIVAATDVSSRAQQAPGGSAQPGVDARQLSAFLGSAANEINGFWSKQVKNYQPPQRFEGYVEELQTPCGKTLPRNAFYCSGDHGIYYDLRWFAELYTRKGDYATVHILAHEWGHLVQRLLGLLEPEAGLWSIETEVQADCLAGVFARFAEQTGRLEEGDRGEAVNMLYEGGDADTPWFDPQAHGNPGQRVNAFHQGYTGRECSGPDFYRAVGLDIHATPSAPTPRSGSVRDGLRKQVGAFSLVDAQEVPAMTQRGATEALLLTYSSRDGIRVGMVLAAFQSTQVSQNLVEESLRSYIAKGYRRSWQERLVGPGDQPIGVVTQLNGQDEILIWNAQHVFGFVQGPNQHAKAFVDAWFTGR
jgi:predicted metalloprotease